MSARHRATIAITALVVLVSGTPAAFASPVSRVPIASIEGLAPYAPQTTCSPAAKPGVVSFMKLVLAAYPGTGSSGIVRDCSVGGRSEHKEGRAWDWTVSYANARQRAQAKDLINWLFAPDKYKHKYTNARRLGVMYVIWDRKIWGSYSAGAGWRAYTGADPHTGHMHISFSWAGASKKTSFWTGKADPTSASSPAPGPVSTRPAGPHAAWPGSSWNPREDEGGDVNRDSDRRLHRHRHRHRTPVPLPTWDGSRTLPTAPGVAPAPTPVVGPTEPTVDAPTLSSFANDVLSIVNDERAKVGAAPLTVDACAQGIAQDWTERMAADRTLVHNSLQPLFGCGSGVRTAAENIAYGGQTPAALMSMWMNSPGHRANILNPALKRIGIGIATATDGRIWATQDFVG